MRVLAGTLAKVTTSRMRSMTEETTSMGAEKL